ncbi:hypothetical protein [Kitasatospora sp. NPDC059827]|uniref:hypothetical protein n=1 Tax=Kitasatospora sp. NPDC059827 TaxID=3346964 RepID=UPI003660DF53
MRIESGRRIATVLGGLAVVVGVAVAQAPTASAWDSNTHLNKCGIFFNQNCGHGGVGDNNRRVFAYDQRADDNGFRTEYRMTNGDSGAIKDPDGDGGGSGQIWTPAPVKSYRVCSEQGNDYRFWPCSEWINVL